MHVTTLWRLKLLPLMGFVQFLLKVILNCLTFCIRKIKIKGIK